MNRRLFLFIVLLAFAPGLGCTQEPPAAEEQAEVDRANADLDHVYQAMMIKLDREQQNSLREAQRAWIKWRDAEADLMARLSGAVGGSAYRVDYSTSLARLIRERTQVLRERGKIENDAYQGNDKQRTGEREAQKGLTQEQGKPATISPTKADTGEAKPVTADALFAAFNSNKFVAEEKYGGRRLLITGEVYNVGKDGGVYVDLACGNIGNAFRCRFKREDFDRVIRLPRGAVITFTGTIQRGMFDSPINMQLEISDCRLR